MRILVVNVNTSESMTESIAQAARRYASPGTETVALQPYFGAEAVDCNFESYLAAGGGLGWGGTLHPPLYGGVGGGVCGQWRRGPRELVRPAGVGKLGGPGHPAQVVRPGVSAS